MRRAMIWLAACALLALMPTLHTVAAQGGSDACPEIVVEALAAVGDACAGLGRNEACYGHYRVDAELWEANADLEFVEAADRISLVDLHWLRTSPLDVEDRAWGIALLQVQAGVPESLPGQAVTFLLMGDARLENAVSPEQAATVQVAAVTNAGANLRSGPGMTFNLVGSLPPGTAVPVAALDESGVWAQVIAPNGDAAWVFAALLAVDDQSALAALPAAEDAAVRQYAPMQAVYLEAGLGEPVCNEAPDALVVQGHADTVITLRVNDLDVTLGSTVILTTVALPDGTAVLVGVLLEGHLAAHFGTTLAVALAAPGDAFAVTLNAAGRVDAESALVDLSAEADLAGRIENTARRTCQYANSTGVLERALAALVCETALTYLTPPPGAPDDAAPDAAGGDDAAAQAPASLDGSCTVAATNNVNLRGGPGTGYDLRGQLAAGQTAQPDGRAAGADGLLWWRLNDGAWLRSDLVTAAGACSGLPLLAAPAPAPSLPSNSAGSTQQHIVGIHFPTGCEFGDTVPAGVPLLVTMGKGYDTEADALADMGTANIYIDGVVAEPATRTIRPWGDGTYVLEIQYLWGTPPPGVYTLSGIDRSMEGPVVRTCVLTITQ